MMVSYKTKGFDESALLIDSTVLSKDSNSPPSQSLFAAFDPRGSDVGPPTVANMVFYMSQRPAETTLLLDFGVRQRR
jgi:hypothetical protein